MKKPCSQCGYLNPDATKHYKCYTNDCPAYRIANRLCFKCGKKLSKSEGRLCKDCIKKAVKRVRLYEDKSYKREGEKNHI